MSLFRLLNERRDEWTSSFRGLDGIEAKPEIYNENIPAFRHQGARLGFKKDLRTDEQAQKDFTPFVNKKSPEYLASLRNSEWEGSNPTELGFAAFFNPEAAEAEENYQAQDEFGDEDDYEEEEGEPYEGYAEDAEYFAGADTLEEIKHNRPPGDAQYALLEKHNERVRRYFGSVEAIAYKARQMETLSMAFQSADSLREKQMAYDNFLEAALKGGYSKEEFLGTFGERPEEAAMVGGGGSAAFALPASYEEQIALDDERDAAVNEEYIQSWLTYKTGMKLNNAELTRVARDFGVKGRLPNTAAIIAALMAKGKSPDDMNWEKPSWK